MQIFRLNNGQEFPAIGSGTNTFGKANRDYMGEITFDTTEIASAIRAGYRHFDTAISYRNEEVVGIGLKDSGLDRSEFYITTKIPGRPEYYATEDAVKAGVAESLKNLGTDYIDLYLIHHPWEDLEEMLAMWRVLESYADQGVLRSIGVSNFSEEQLEYFREHARIQPAVNQIESHPGHWNHELVNYCIEHNILPVAWGPLRQTTDVARFTLNEIGKRHNKSGAQVSLRYQLDRGVAVIPKSHNAERQAENLEIFDFKLTAEEHEQISKL